jgi:hypothetical protein
VQVVTPPFAVVVELVDVLVVTFINTWLVDPPGKPVKGILRLEGRRSEAEKQCPEKRALPKSFHGCKSGGCSKEPGIGQVAALHLQ